MNTNQSRALAALLTSRTHIEAAEKSGLSVRTINYYLADEEFNKAYSKAARRLVDDATRNMQKSLKPALDALVDIVSNPHEQAGARVQASRAILEFTLKYTEFNDVLKVIETDAEEVEADVL